VEGDLGHAWCGFVAAVVNGPIEFIEGGGGGAESGFHVGLDLGPVWGWLYPMPEEVAYVGGD